LLPLVPVPFSNKIDRLLEPSGAIRRSIIRHLVLAVDLSSAMLDRDMRPSRFHLTLEYAREFIGEWFDQNPLGQMAIVGMRSGLGEKISPMTGKLPKHNPYTRYI
jgi:transcription initiation factor TFIIH subunit 2